MADIYFVSKYKVKGVDNYASIQECYDYIKNKVILGIDIETSKRDLNEREKKGAIYRGGLDPYLSSLIMLQIGDLERIFVIDTRVFTKEDLKCILDFINWNPRCIFVGVNLKFEGKHLRHKYGVRLKRVWDCMVVEMCLYNGLNRPFSLAGMSKQYLNVGEISEIELFEMSRKVTLNDEHLLENSNMITPFDEANAAQIDKSTRMQFITIGKRKFDSKQILYGADDILYPLLIMERQLLGRKLDSGEVYLPIKLFKLENSFTQVVADMELNGMPFNSEYWLDISKSQQELYEERLDCLNLYVEFFYPEFTEPANLFNEKRKCFIEWGSSKQVISIFRSLDICPKEFSKQTKKLDWTVGAVALLKTLSNEYKNAYHGQQWLGFELDEDGILIEDNQRFILAFLLMKRSEQAVTTFGKEWLKYVHAKTGRVHSNFRQILNSGRVASSSPNIQQIPSGKYRKAFSTVDTSLVFADYSNQEVRTVACLAKEDSMVNFFVNGHAEYGDDMHMYTANQMNLAQNPNAKNFPAKGTEGFLKMHADKRQEAKIINFGILYGKEAKGFAEDFGLTKEEAQLFIDNYFAAYPNLKKSMDKWEKDTMNDKFIKIDTTIDRRWFSDDFDVMDEISEEVREYYPTGYFERGYYSQQEKDKIKQELNEEYPQIKELWKKFFGIRGSIARKSCNFRIQGCLPRTTKILTKQGYIPIGDFEVGTIWTGDNWATATRLDMGFDTLLKLNLSDGNSFHCDTRHKLLTINSENKFEWTLATDIIGKQLETRNYSTKEIKLFVTSIEELPQEQMYTLSVDDDKHCYVSEGLISKNCSASETKAGLIMLRNQLIKDNHEDILIIVSVHDENGLEVPKEKEGLAVKMLEKCMSEGANLFLSPKIMKATAEVANYWTH